MEGTNPKPFVFVLMPFSEDFRDTYEVGIKAACKDAGAYCERVDEQIFTDNILERVYNQIAKADIIVSEMTGRNPNVFYETGYAHALNKQVILLTHKDDDIPFDLKHYPHIVYGGRISFLKTELERRIQWAIEHPKESISRIEFSLDIYINGIPQTNASPLIIRRNQNRGTIEANINLQNPTNKVYTQGDTIGIITPPLLESAYLNNKHEVNSITLPDGKLLYILGDIQKILPSGWLSFVVQLHTKELNNKQFRHLYLKQILGSPQESTIRIFTEIGPKDYPITLEVDTDKAYLIDTYLPGAKLARAKLTGANLTGANLTGANLTQADLTGAHLPGAHLPGADLTGAILTGADLAGADLTQADLTGADLTGADLTRADLTRAVLTAAKLARAHLAGADLTQADLTQANLKQAYYNNKTQWPKDFTPPPDAINTDSQLHS